MADRVTNRGEAPGTEVHRALPHRLACLLILDLRESKTRLALGRVTFAERLSDKFLLGYVAAGHLRLELRIHGLRCGEHRLVPVTG